MDFTIDTQNKEFQDALSLIQYTRQSVFLTGKAGTGKSTFLKYICQNTKKKHVVLAPTGIAAINAGGSTMHSFFKLPFHPLLPDDPNLSLQRGRIHDFLRYNKQHRKLIEQTELIIIDEISMVRADTIDAIDRILRVYSRNLRQPFGGKQILLVGDVFQLEPVIKNDEREIITRFYPTPYFFSARVFAEIDLVSIELCKVYRQTDKVFVSILDRIRNNTAGAPDLQLLNTRYNTSIKESEEDMYITLATRRDTVDFINDKKLEELPGEPVVFEGEITGEFPENSLPTPKDLVLKTGAQIIFIKNDYDRRWVNGTIGVVSGIDEEGTIYVVTDQGQEFDVKKDSWRNIRYKYNEKKKEIEEEELGVFVQYPIRLAWAITIHKSQGLTFSQVIIDFTGGVFAGGQAYVALSRCTSLEGIQLKKPISRGDIFVRPEIVNFAERFNNRQAIDKALKQAQADVQYAEATRAFDEGDFDAFLEHFFIAIHSRYDIEKPNIKRLIRKKLGIINKLKAENVHLKERMTEQKKNLQKYAREYYQMGNEAITHAHDVRAAIANYDKALELYPEMTDAWVRKGVTLFNNGDFEEAENCFNTAIQINPVEFKAIYNRGKLRLNTNNIDGAIADFDKATTLKPDHAGAHEQFGDALLRSGREDLAGVQWRLAEILKKKKKSGKMPPPNSHID
ncbi:tetratricopeptide repeat protein [Bacteroides sp. 51]|uniref:tetratricopeptide repeat protein n=1 Tax=Bacteroides sp. 51 TaxID=2302938 RepID=UPI0013D25A93|nr:tetratricopeptide repeat protein [Bacteroides sp. 51]